MRCEQIMKRSVKCLGENDSVHEAAVLMRDENIGFVPICDATGRAIGIVTDRDIVLRIASDKSALEAAVGSVMSKDVVTCAPTDSMAFAESRMREWRKSRILVVDQFQKPLGVISLSDLAQADRPSRVGRVLRALTAREARA